MPIIEKIAFKNVLEKGSRIQVPKLIRWEFKVETNQLLNVGVNDINTQIGWQFFFAKMSKEGRIRIPLVIIKLLQTDESDITGHVLK